MSYHKPQGFSSRQLLAGGSVLLALGLVIDGRSLPMWGSKPSMETCEQITKPEASLSRDQLAKLLTVPEGDNKAKIRQIAKEPYCQLAKLSIRAGATAVREAYPLDFDAQTWLIVLYEGDQYAGYRFSFR